MRLADVIDVFIAGDWGNESPSEETPNAVYCVRGADIVPISIGEFGDIPLRYVSDKSFEEKTLRAGDMIVEKSGGSPTQSTGRVSYVSEALITEKGAVVCTNFCVAFRVKTGWNPYFVYQYWNHIYNNNIFFNFEGKTSGLKNLQLDNALKAIEIPDYTLEQQNRIAETLLKIEQKVLLNRAINHNCIVWIPELEEQKRIGKLLRTIDLKIELNRQLNHNLEAMAKQLYDYWFVQFDFPDENGKPYKSSGGKMVWDKRLKREIPLLWKAKIVEEVADVYNGATPSTVNELNYGGDIVWITPKDLSDQKQKFVYQGERNISQVGYDSCSTHLLPSNTILMSSRAPIGLLAIAKTELCTNQGFKSFVSKSKNIATYLYYYLQYHITQIEQLGTGTTFKEVSREDILKFPMLKPSDNVLDLWEEIVSALNDRQLEIQKENENLIKQRDELLPLLMNGQVSVNYDFIR